ncbi:MAG: XisI protein [Chloroflexi bacterium]|nr:XisI protein [Chloroflexota bacterium]
MDTLVHYRSLIKQVIDGHAKHKPVFGEIRIETIFDEEQDHYSLVHSGWDGMRRIEGMVSHIDIVNDKIWVQHDGTEYGVARELEDLGVSRKDIVLGFHSPAKRALTGYAVG